MWETRTFDRLEKIVLCCHPDEPDMPSAAQSFFLLFFFVATKKMKLLSGNPDGFDFIFKVY